MSVSPTPLHGRRALSRGQMVWLTAIVLIAAVVVILAVRDDSTTSSGIQGSGNAATETRAVAPFNTLDLAGSNNVIVHLGGKRSVVVHADDNLIDTVTTQVHGGRLVIGTSGTFSTKTPMHVDVNVPSLDALILSGSGNLIADRIDARALTVRLTGSGVMRASGTATRLDVALKGSGVIQLGQLVARDVRAALESSGQIAVTATNRLDASVSGSGVILYGGSPAHVTKNVSGSGAVVGG